MIISRHSFSIDEIVSNCFFNCPAAGQAAPQVPQDCLGCMCQASTGCNTTIGCTGGSQYLCGPFLISWAYWADGGKSVLVNDNADRLGGTSPPIVFCLSSISRFSLSDLYFYCCKWAPSLRLKMTSKVSSGGALQSYCMKVELIWISLIQLSRIASKTPCVLEKPYVATWLGSLRYYLNFVCYVLSSVVFTRRLLRNRIATTTASSTVTISLGFTSMEAIRVHLPSTNQLSSSNTSSVGRTSRFYPVDSWKSVSNVQ